MKRFWNGFAMVVVVGTIALGSKMVFGGTADAEVPPVVDQAVPATEPLGSGAVWHPGEPYTIDQRAAWTEAQLTLPEQDALNAGADPTDWIQANKIYEAINAQNAVQSNARMSAARLGLGGLGEIGVIP